MSLIEIILPYSIFQCAMLGITLVIILQTWLAVLCYRTGVSGQLQFWAGVSLKISSTVELNKTNRMAAYARRHHCSY